MKITTDLLCGVSDSLFDQRLRRLYVMALRMHCEIFCESFKLLVSALHALLATSTVKFDCVSTPNLARTSRIHVNTQVFYFTAINFSGVLMQFKRWSSKLRVSLSGIAVCNLD